jgi:hypothetical protein
LGGLELVGSFFSGLAFCFEAEGMRSWIVGFVWVREGDGLRDGHV